MPSILVENVSIDFPVIGTGARSFRHATFAKAKRFRRTTRVGGRVVDGPSAMQVVRALDSISFSLKSGDRLGLMGPNGAGKTTLIRALAGIYGPATGRLDVEGKRIPMFDINIGLDEEATGYENIYIRGLIMGLSAKRIDQKTAEIAEYSGLGDYLNMPIRTYSSGMVLRLMFAITTSVEGDIVLMDEWLAVGDAQFREKAQARLMSIAESAGILVIASHDASLLKRICTLGLHLEGGRVKSFGPIDDVLAGLAETNKADHSEEAENQAMAAAR